MSRKRMDIPVQRANSRMSQVELDLAWERSIPLLWRILDRIVP